MTLREGQVTQFLTLHNRENTHQTRKRMGSGDKQCRHKCHADLYIGDTFKLEISMHHYDVRPCWTPRYYVIDYNYMHV